MSLILLTCPPVSCSTPTGKLAIRACLPKEKDPQPRESSRAKGNLGGQKRRDTASAVQPERSERSRTEDCSPPRPMPRNELDRNHGAPIHRSQPAASPACFSRHSPCGGARSCASTARPRASSACLASPLSSGWLIGSASALLRSGRGPAGSTISRFFIPAPHHDRVFTSIFTMMSVIEDRKEGFLLSVLVAPVARSAIVLAKFSEATTLSAIQGLIFWSSPITVSSPPDASHVSRRGGLPVSLRADRPGLRYRLAMDSSQAFHGIVTVCYSTVAAVRSLFLVRRSAGFESHEPQPLTYGVDPSLACCIPASSPRFLFPRR